MFSCHLKDSFIDRTIGFPDANELSGDDRDKSYFIVVNDALTLRTWLMKPFSVRSLTNEESLFNYRLSTECPAVENATLRTW